MLVRNNGMQTVSHLKDKKSSKFIHNLEKKPSETNPCVYACDSVVDQANEILCYTVRNYSGMVFYGICDGSCDVDKPFHCQTMGKEG
jgi:hypothetical protein